MRKRHSQALKNKIRHLYLQGYNRKQIMSRTQKPFKIVRTLMYNIDFNEYTPEDFDFARTELKRINEQYDNLTDYSSPREKFLQKKYKRLQDLLRRHGELQLYVHKDVMKMIKGRGLTF